MRIYAQIVQTAHIKRSDSLGIIISNLLQADSLNEKYRVDLLCGCTTEHDVCYREKHYPSVKIESGMVDAHLKAT